MQKKRINFKTKGMNRDLSVSAFNPEFSFDNRNLRLSTIEGNTMLSWVNEKGTKEIKLEILSSEATDEETVDTAETVLTQIGGVVIGIAVLPDYLIVFAHRNSISLLPAIDWVYRFTSPKIKNSELVMEGRILFYGNLGLDSHYLLETLPYYESETIQKIYWTDGLNQPRVINVTAPYETRRRWHIKTRKEKASWQDDFQYKATCFDFVPSIDGLESMSVVKNSGGGIFEPGVIQYCFTYLYKNGQQSNIACVSPIYYLSFNDRGASPEEKVSCSFTINLTNIDKHYQYVRLYSIHRTSLDSDPVIKHLEDLEIEKVITTEGDLETLSCNLTYTDLNTTGSIIDPYELLYVGGHSISANTLVSKDNTLFIGNLTENFPTTPIKDEHAEVYFTDDSVNNTNIKTITLDEPKGIYSYTSLLKYSQNKITTFKYKDYYRFGYQLQTATGEWTNPIYVNTIQNNKHPVTSYNDRSVKLPFAQIKVKKADIQGYVKIRPVVVYPSINDRTVLCQGVLNPTVFNASDRISNSPFAQASWYFRPFVFGDGASENPDLSIKYDNTIAPVSTHPNLFPGNCSLMWGLLTTIENEADAKELADAGFLHLVILEKSHFTPGYHVDSSLDVPFDMVIKLKIDQQVYQYVFLRSAGPWPDAVGDSTVYIHTTIGDTVVDSNVYHYPSVMTNIQRFAYTVSVYDNLKKVNSFYYYYKNSDWDYTDPFYIECTIKANGSTTYYDITMPSQGDDTEVPSDTTDRGGSHIEFKHYESLPCQGSSPNPDKSVEIQGSLRTYSDAFDTANKVITSNTQYFVDQSILTLNSPDIEFDTNVQNYATDELELHVIGAIPITAYSSASSIQASAQSADIDGKFGGYKPLNISYPNLSVNAGKRLVSEYLWSDVYARKENPSDENVIVSILVNYKIFPWHSKGSLCHDPRSESEAYSVLKQKKESSLLYSFNTVYGNDGNGDYASYSNIGCQIALTENSTVHNIRLPQQTSSNNVAINYYPNIDKVLYNENGYYLSTDTEIDFKFKSPVRNAIPMKYKSTSHAVVSLGDASATHLPLMVHPSSIEYNLNDNAPTFWGQTYSYDDRITDAPLFNGNNYSFLWLGELRKKNVQVSSLFGGDSDEALKSNNWVVCGASYSIPVGNSGNVTINCTIGDTYYQRYDCLKTYASTPEDVNQLVEILSFMCETHVNLDGRYDRNRGLLDNTNVSPQNFNLLNPVYSQKNNFFNYKIVDDNDVTEKTYPNKIWYSKSKESGADVDAYTNVTLSSILELDGTSGPITSLQKFNDQIVAFQEEDMSQILYNENVQIASTTGVPIEIANSGKVQGSRSLSNGIGCKNKWSIANTPNGLYFADSKGQSIYCYNGQLNNLSLQKGFDAWSKNNVSSIIKTFYDNLNQEVLFRTSGEVLAYSEKFGAFTSFYDYSSGKYFANFDGQGIWIDALNHVWKHQAGEYCQFFGKNKPYSMTLVGNSESQMDKLFTNLEFRASVEGEGQMETTTVEDPETHEETIVETGRYLPSLPFDSLETWNEYQHGIAQLDIRNGHAGMLHHLNNSTGAGATIKRKFRIWRCDIPRDNYPVAGMITDIWSNDDTLGITRFASHPNDRMRNPWLYIKLMKQAAGSHEEIINEGEEDEQTITVLDSMPKAEIHDIALDYFN